jgi:transposase-like protein
MAHLEALDLCAMEGVTRQVSLARPLKRCQRIVQLSHAQYPSDVIALVVLWRLRYRLTLRDLAEMFHQRGFVFSHEAVRDWEAKLAPVLADELRRRRGKGGAGRRSWHVDET